MPQAQTVTVGSRVVHYRVGGRGEPLVLIHGLAASGAWWIRNVDALSQYHTVYVLDLPGFGAMRRYPERFSIADSAVWIERLFDALGLEQASVIGHSMGALITAIFAARCPARLKRIVLAAPAIGLPSDRISAYLLPLLREIAGLNRSFYGTLAWDAARAGFLTGMRASRELLTLKIERELSQIATPCLLLWGERDPLVPVELSRSLQSKIRDSKLCVLKGAGHILMHDHAEQFNRAVLEFLHGCWGG